MTPPSHASDPNTRQTDDLRSVSPPSLQHASGNSARMHLDTAAANSLTDGPSQATQQQQQQSQQNPDPEPQAAISPPFWNPHARTLSSASYHSLDDRAAAAGPHPISLEDHTTDTAAHPPSESCWAQSVTIDSYTILTGPTGIGAYVVWSCSISVLPQTSSTGNATSSTNNNQRSSSSSHPNHHDAILHLRKRYSEFDALRTNLVRSFPHAEAMIPDLPRKSFVSKFRPWFLEQRRLGLEHFLNCILLNPEFASSPVVKGFVFE
ncbi:hypothetical protein D0869_05687 [Hortaea werneckii]|uniref:Endosomal/vacuolar adapter protein YPT35 n=1 Tax=Hortaea werneckii TaxID=91943 RepID=A0A3M6WWA2_HORWE|nr:hypothetical protein KC334_g13904 [Hortaea werneckii]KAI6952850.1 hypothetical protein KC355_g13872 [Hortaea werneckii]KAI7151271.1 hypothetical protein KC324_g15191 [Hortaea werneckii]KAI7654225.1 hypothetical protein KC318_g13726 [Hortaea werneckii]RMX82924.1 hypothetical protein D0869_05687 [Hortaea werneckii]